MFRFGRLYCKFFFLKISSDIKSPPPPNRHKNHPFRKAKSVDKLWGGGGGTRYMLEAESLKLIKHVWTEEEDDILEELDL